LEEKHTGALHLIESVRYLKVYRTHCVQRTRRRKHLCLPHERSAYPMTLTNRLSQP
jgi:hypothetical protein